MISEIREHFKSGSRVVLAFIMISFIIGLMPLAYKTAVKSTSIWAMRINGEEIDYKQFMFERERQRERIIAFRQQYGEYADWLLSMMGVTDPQALAMQSLTRQILVKQFADRLGLQMGADYIAEKLNDPQFVMQELADVIPHQLIDPVMGLNHAMLSNFLKHRRVPVEIFEREIEEKLTDKAMMKFIASTLYVPRFDSKQKYQTEHAKRSFSILSLSLDSFLKKEKEKAVSTDDLERFYGDQNKQAERYWVPEKRSGTSWTFDPQSYGITVTDEQIERYYENNKIKRFIDKPAMVQVRRILFTVPSESQRAAVYAEASRIKDEIMQDSSQFAAIAERVSEDKESASNGGLLEPFARGSHEQSFDKGAFLLQKDGAVSEVIETSKGYEILQRVNKMPQQFKPLASVKSDIAQILQRQKFEQQFSQDMRKILESEESLTAFIKQKGGTPNKIDKALPADSSAAERLFKIKPGERAFFVEDDKGIAVQLTSIQERYLPSLESIKATVENDYRIYKARKALQEALAEVKKKLASSSLKAVQKEWEGATFMQTGMIQLSDQEAAESLKNKGVPTAHMLQMEKVGSVVTEIEGDYGFLIRLDEIEPLNQEKYEEAKAETMQTLQQERTQQYLEGFVASLQRNAKIETNEQVITLQV